MSDRPPTSPRSLLVAAGWLAAGCGLRVGLALGRRGTVAEHEADGFVRAFEGWQPTDLARARPVGVLAVQDALGWFAGGSVLGVRLGCVLLSLLALACAALLLRVALRRDAAAGPAARRPGIWLVAAWALWPALAGAAIEPVGASALGAVLCLLAAAACSWWRRRTLLSGLLLSAAVAAAVLVGGVGAVLGVGLATLLFVASLPAIQVAGPLLLAVVLGGGLAVALSHEPNRPLVQEGAAGHSLLALTGGPAPPVVAATIDPKGRDAAALRAGRQALSAAGAGELVAALTRRLAANVWGPARFATQDALAMALAAAEALLRAAALAGACLLLFRPRAGRSLWLGVSVAAGLCAWWLATLATASDPWALTPFDLLLVALAAAAAGDEWISARRRLLLGLAVLAALPALWLIATVPPTRGWTWMSRQAVPEGAMLVGLLRDGGPHDVAGELTATALLTDPEAPFLRLPEAAVRHAQAALRHAPDDPRAVLAAARAHAEALDFETARALASSLVGDDGLPVPDAAALMQVFAALESRLRLERLP